MVVDVEVWVELGGVDVPVESVVVVVGPQAATANEAAANTSNFNLFVFMIVSLLEREELSTRTNNFKNLQKIFSKTLLYC